jgi:hypothetical protein
LNLVSRSDKVSNLAKYPLGSIKRSPERLGKLDGIPALFDTIKLFRQGTTTILVDLPAACHKTGVEALSIDRVLLEGSTIAEYLLDV